ncbi:hypothetical protein [Oerskovia merdavium]|uniref:Uncharacterized protein n=1 Tax=Oerskovia merdavium TaxID=2762227 RepID=A0ABR8TW77_9CELL|nr:hypothetical protein [Oerskovia merdavium]MBD7980041.1 hypothetical protein [Oerskovia merdavium]
MNEPEALNILMYLNRAGLIRMMEDQGAVWADILQNVAFKDAEAAAREIARTRLSTDRWVVPGDILALVNKTRNRYYNQIPPALREVPELEAFKVADRPWENAHPRQYHTFSMTYTRALTDGLDPQAALDIACERAGIPTTKHEAWANHKANQGALPARSYEEPPIDRRNEWMFR